MSSERVKCRVTRLLGEYGFAVVVPGDTRVFFHYADLGDCGVLAIGDTFTCVLKDNGPGKAPRAKRIQLEHQRQPANEFERLLGRHLSGPMMAFKVGMGSGAKTTRKS